MSTSIRESILEDIKTVLLTITTGNGYTNTIASVERWKQKGNDIKLVPCIVILSGPEAKSPGADPQTDCDFQVILDVWMCQDDTAVTNSDTILSSLLLDIEKALMQDSQRAGYADDTNLISAVPFETVEGQPYFGLLITLEIKYSHNRKDPAVYV
jgi:hypothetical protein